MLERKRVGRTLAVVLNYEGEHDTIECLQWLKGLMGVGACVVVVDNGSSAESLAAIRSAHPDVELLALVANIGFSAGNNRGVAHGTGLAEATGASWEFVWLVNNDTTGEATALEFLEATADKDGQIGAVGSMLVSPAPDRRVQSRGMRVSSGFSLTWTNHTRGGAFNSLCGASMLIRTAALEQVGLLDETFFFCWEDADLCQRLLAAGWKLAVAEDSVVTHKEGATATAASPFRIFHHVRGIVLFARRHSPLPWFSATFAALLCAASCLVMRQRPKLLVAVWSGFVDGWRARPVPIPALPRKVTISHDSGRHSTTQGS